jgi:predicted DCC family thiol-disulfide oxidoreductase YuxK
MNFSCFYLLALYSYKIKFINDKKERDMKNIILFDGVCNLCSLSVGFIVKRDSRAYFSFASVESMLGKQLLKEYKLQGVDSLILIENNQAYIYSEAVLRIAKGLSSWHRFLYAFHYLPLGFRDALYRFIARHRYAVFGKKESCMLPSDELLERFLDT